MGDTNELAPNRKRSRDGPFKCRNCDREFPSAQALGGHRSGYSKPLLQWMPPGVAPFTCPECDQKFLTRKSLTRHKRRRHHVNAGKEAGSSSSSGTKESGEQSKIKKGGKKTVNPAAKTSDDGVKMAETTVENIPRLKNIDLNLTPFINFVEHGVLFS